MIPMTQILIVFWNRLLIAACKQHDRILCVCACWWLDNSAVLLKWATVVLVTVVKLGWLSHETDLRGMTQSKAGCFCIKGMTHTVHPETGFFLRKKKKEVWSKPNLRILITEVRIHRVMAKLFQGDVRSCYRKHFTGFLCPCIYTSFSTWNCETSLFTSILCLTKSQGLL